MRTIPIILLAGLLTACATDPAKVEAVASDEAARLKPPTRLLSTYDTFRLEQMTFGEAIQVEEKKMVEAREFETAFKAKIEPLLATWNAADSASAEGTLSIQPHLAALRIISGGARFWAGAFAGDSFIDLDLRLVDADTGVVVADVRINRDADAMTGAWSIGKSDQNLDEYIVAIAEEYLTDSY
jgi:curli biogenesis system outer membrane secretion channel CsgG